MVLYIIANPGWINLKGLKWRRLRVPLLLMYGIFSTCVQASVVQLNIDSNGEQSGYVVEFANAGVTLVGIDDLLIANIDLATLTITEVTHFGGGSNLDRKIKQVVFGSEVLNR